MTTAAPCIRASDIALVFVGGTIGTAARLAVTLWLGAGTGLAVVNIVGAFLLGVLTAVLTCSASERNRRANLLLGTGALGGFTTYSALAVAGADLAWLLFAALIALAGVMAAALGFALGGGFGGAQKRGGS